MSFWIIIMWIYVTKIYDNWDIEYIYIYIYIDYWINNPLPHFSASGQMQA